MAFHSIVDEAGGSFPGASPGEKADPTALVDGRPGGL